MKRIALLVTGLLAMAGADAQVYQYKDAAGRMVYSDQPPPPGVRSSKTVSSEPANIDSTPNPKSQKTLSDRDVDFKKRQQENQEKAAKEQKERSAANDRKENCAMAQKQLSALESGQRISTQNEAGERSFIDEDQRAKEIERSRRIVAENCGR